jgi:hypothetical protein
MGVWAFLDACLLAAGAVALALSIAWRAPNLLMNMVFSEADLTGTSLLETDMSSLSPFTAGTVLGVALLITFGVSLGAIVQRNHVTIGLVILNWLLILDALGILIIGTFVWFFTLQERAEFHALWVKQTPANRIVLQDKVGCASQAR